ncbi:dipicolinate synthase subunit B [Desulforamulus hydrothermalis]|uniref:Dipicolinate synthase, B chain n=1 Tax=Desulforamulus hydrothermalis Lam5 = DSM 18033 TaxID=1121428 RepID=K8ECK2_9FIRM|nr:dipicolinate synthase subunit B [Desulforamulus hydrothermalis]CCO09408.1 Dipicolinate synthase, B chain [Desulforamulus hydrothermalis Lam5 = DSM 18033]SHH08778.1 dipicolinate synthase subunit B [Desulforamulus hydrothermalis Lam5 = DSM 18033]
MRLKGIRIGFALTGSHCTLDEVMPRIQELVDQGAEVLPIVSYAVDTMDTRFGTVQKWRDLLKQITGKEPINSISGAEPVGPDKLVDVVVIAPCTGNTMAKLANGITDTPVLMAAKAHLRNQRPVVLAISTNDGLGINAKNLGLLLNTKNVYMVPFGQDSPTGKPNSLKSRMDLIIDTIEQALQGKQIQPILVQP